MNLIDIVTKFCNNEMEVEEFTILYDNEFYAISDRVESLYGEQKAEILEEIYFLISYFEPDPNIRKESTNYLDAIALKGEVESLRSGLD